MSGIPLRELSEEIGEAIGGRRVLAAVFTTFTFDPGFFELEVLPVLFDKPFSQVAKVKRIQLEDALRETEVAVYYDRAGLVADAEPASLDFRRIDVRRRTGCFHPKVVLVLVEEARGEEDERDGTPERALIVACLSANLTRAGWWENVEAGHVEVVRPPQASRDTWSFRGDLLRLIAHLRRGAAEGEEHTALDVIEGFAKRDAPRREPKYASVDGRHHTRIFVGQEHLADWLAGLRLGRLGYHLEVVSPYLDKHGAGALRRLVEALQPDGVRVLLPIGVDGKPTVTEKQYEDVARYATWARLPEPLVRSGPKASTEKAPPRRVHAKVLRLWARGAGEIVVVGSANLTEAGMGNARGGNLEASFLVDVEHGGTWLLEPIEQEPATFAEKPAEEADEGERVGAALSLRYDWSRGRLETRLEEPFEGEVEVATIAGEALLRIDGRQAGGWRDAGKRASERMGELLASTSVLAARTHPAAGGSGCAWRVLVREEGMAHKPSLLLSLTPEEILLYWSLLTSEQREAFLVEKLGVDAVIEGLNAGRGQRYRIQGTLFDRFAGLFHAFERVREAVRRAVQEEQPREAEALLFGAKYDSVPVLLRRVRERIESPPEGEEPDPVHAYVTFLCARQLVRRVRTEHADLWRSVGERRKPLEDELARAGEIEARLPLPEGEETARFLEWYEQAFLGSAEDLEASVG